MACLESNATGIKELFDKLVNFLTDAGNFANGNQWEMLSPSVLVGQSTNPDTGEINPGTEEVILKGKGGGTDSIYVGMKIERSQHQQDIVLNGYAGFDQHLEWWEQPGAIWHKKLPIIPLAEDVAMNFWITANTKRFILVVEMSSQYESAYVGLMKPISIERQYAYPLVIAGSYIQGGKWTSRSSGHNAFFNPGSDTYSGIGDYNTALPAENGEENTSSFRLRRPDGTWVSAININNAGKTMGFEHLCLWPYNTNPKETYTVYRKKDEISKLEDNMMYEIKLYESYPVGNIGVLDGAYFVGNRVDLAAKDTIVYKDRTYKVFNNIFRREDDSYVAIEWA